jgi:photosystem II stability/assembly factor-like uncharacterized protein
MRKTIFYLCIIFLLSLIISANAQWRLTSGPEGGLIDGIGSNGSSTIFCAPHNNGVYRSTDNGLHWKSSGLSNKSIYSFFFKGNYVFALDGNIGLYRSGNNGSTWTDLNFTQFPWCMTVKGSYIYMGLSSGIIRSADNGNTWVTLTDSLAMKPYNCMTYNSTYIFAGGFGNIVRSSNNGIYWTSLNITLPEYTSINHIYANGAIILAIPSGGGLYRSTNNGNSWVFLDLNGLSIASFARIGNYIFATGSVSGNNGIYRSNDNGLSWELINNDLVSTVLTSMTVNNKYIFVGMGKFGISRSATNGDDWTIANSGLKTMNITNILNLDNDLYASVPNDGPPYVGGGIYYSKNSGNNWTDYNIGLPDDLDVTCLAADKNSYTVYAGTANGIYYTSPTVDVWTSLNSDISETKIISLAVNGKTIYAGGYMDGIYKTTDGGQSWIQLITYGRFKSIAIGPSGVFALQTSTHGKPSSSLNLTTDGGTTWTEVASFSYPNTIQKVITKGNYIFLGNTQGIYRSNDNGLNWIKTNNGISDSNITALYVYNNKLIAGTQTGKVYSSANNGDTWLSLSSGLPSRVINCFASNKNYLFTGIDNNSIWRNESVDNLLISKNTDNELNKFTLSQNYPNPFNPATNIDFDLPFDSKVSIVLYDITGKEVKTLVNDARTAGYYTIQFNASDLSSGTYFYRITAKSNGGDYVMTKKMMLVK